MAGTAGRRAAGPRSGTLWRATGARLDQPAPPFADFKLVFNMVGNFEPSYTEYVTEYHLSELWQPGEKGYQTHVLKGAHKTQDVKGEPVKK